MSRIERDLVKLVTDSAAQAAPGATATLVRSRDWSSSLFNGTRLILDVAAPESEAFETWLAGLPDAEFSLRGHFVASADIVERREGIATIEFLLVEEN